MTGKWVVTHNGEVVAEGENEINTSGCLHTVEFDEPIQCNLDSPPITIGYTFTAENEMPNESNRRNLKAQMDLLSDAHADITTQAAHANHRILYADERNVQKVDGGKLALKWAGRQLEILEDMLGAQEDRIARVREEVEQIRKNLKTV